MKHGDFTSLTDDYARHRPSYAPSVLDAFLGLARAARGKAALICADRGARIGGHA